MLMLENIPNSLKSDPNFARYCNKWKSDERSIVFIPLAEILRRNELLDEAIQVCKKGLFHHPESVSGRVQLARILGDRREIEEARKILLDILSCIPDHAEAKEILDDLAGKFKEDYLNTPTMAEICLSQGDLKKAIKIYEAILAKDPDDKNVRQKWIELTKRRGL